MINFDIDLEMARTVREAFERAVAKVQSGQEGEDFAERRKDEAE